MRKYGLFILLFSILQSKAQTNNSAQLLPLSPQSLHAQRVTLRNDSINQIRKTIAKQIIRNNSEQSYLSIPKFGEFHFGSNSTYRRYIVTGNPTPRFFIGTDRKTRLLGEIFMNTTIRIIDNVSYSPRYNRNIFWDLSAPVRTPSFRVGGTLYIDLGRAKKDSKAYKNVEEMIKTPLVKDFPYKLKYLTLTGFHHSNGQDGRHDYSYQEIFMKNAIDKIYDNNLKDLYIDYRKDVSKTEDLTPFKRDFNVYNGNFAVDLIGEIGITFTKYTMGGMYIPNSDYMNYINYQGNNTPKQIKRDSIKYKMGNEVSSFYQNFDRIRSWYIGTQNAILIGEDRLKRSYGTYGVDKIIVKWQGINAMRILDPSLEKKALLNERFRPMPSIFEKDRWVMDFSFAWNSPKSNVSYFKISNRVNLDMRYHFSILKINRDKLKRKDIKINTIRLIKSNSVSYFIGAGWKGQDDYNIYLEDSFPYISVGLVYGLKFQIDQESLKIGKIFRNTDKP